jgi:hypothetical protein
MRKEKDIQALRKIAKLLVEVFISLDEIEDVEKIFNSEKALKVISKYPSINVSIDELISDLVAYFLELKRIYKNDKKGE